MAMMLDFKCNMIKIDLSCYHIIHCNNEQHATTTATTSATPTPTTATSSKNAHPVL
jgi:hypothetical protein